MSKLIEEILNRVQLVELINEYLPLKKKSANNYFGLCPFHQEKTPSFSVSSKKNLYHCFGCGASGNAISFIRDIENKSSYEAISFLAKKVGIDFENKKNEPLDKIYEVLKISAKYFNYLLLNGKDEFINSYLRKRKINNEIIEKFNLGFSNKSLSSYLKNKGFSFKIMEKAGLTVNNRDRFYNRLMFPILDQYNKVVGFGGRGFDENKAKYINSPQTDVYKKSRILYGYNFAKESIDKKKVIYIVEGYFDLITMHNNGYMNTVSTSGTALTEFQAELLKRISNKIILFFDSDLPGKKATERSINNLLKKGMEVEVILLSNVKDPDEFFKEKGNKKKLKLNSISWLDFLIKIYPNKNFEEKKKLYKIIENNLASIVDPILKSKYINSTAYLFGISEIEINNSIKQTNKQTISIKKQEKNIDLDDKNNINDHLIMIFSISQRKDSIGGIAKSKLSRYFNIERNNIKELENIYSNIKNGDYKRKDIEYEVFSIEFAKDENVRDALDIYFSKLVNFSKNIKCKSIIKKIKEAQLNGNDTHKLDNALKEVIIKYNELLED